MLLYTLKTCKVTISENFTKTYKNVRVYGGREFGGNIVWWWGHGENVHQLVIQLV